MSSKKERQINWRPIVKELFILAVTLSLLVSPSRMVLAEANTGATLYSSTTRLESNQGFQARSWNTVQIVAKSMAANDPITIPTPTSTPSAPASPGSLPSQDTSATSDSSNVVVNTLSSLPYTSYIPLVGSKPATSTNPPPGYYVSPSGSDQNPGTFTKPWKTIQKAADTMVGGDTVYIRGGTYNQRVILSYRNNTSGPYITFTNYPGEEVILDGTGIAFQGEGLFHILKTDYIRVSGLKVQHSNGTGIYVGYSNKIIVDNNHTYDTVKSGIGIWGGTNVVVDGNDIALACNSHPNYPASEENISIASGSSNVEVKNNYVHQAANIPDGYSGGEGINIKDGAHDIKVHHNVVHLDERTDGKPSNRLAFGLDGWSHETYNVSFYNNIAYNNASGFVVESEAGATTRDIFVYNNIAYNNSVAGFYIPNWAQNETSLKKNIHFINNTAYNNGIGIFINSVKIETVIIRNNILSQNGTPIKIGSGVPQAQIVSDYNITSGDPKFVNPAGGDFRLQNSSPAIDSGSSLNAPSVDFSGNPRPRGAGYDTGAYEY